MGKTKKKNPMELKKEPNLDEDSGKFKKKDGKVVKKSFPITTIKKSSSSEDEDSDESATVVQKNPKNMKNRPPLNKEDPDEDVDEVLDSDELSDDSSVNNDEIGEGEEISDEEQLDRIRRDLERKESSDSDSESEFNDDGITFDSLDKFYSESERAIRTETGDVQRISDVTRDLNKKIYNIDTENDYDENDPLQMPPSGILVDGIPFHHLRTYPLEERHIKRLYAHGIVYKNSYFSPSEDRQLVINWKRYSSKFNIDFEDAPLYMGWCKYVEKEKLRAVKEEIIQTNLHAYMCINLLERCAIQIRRRCYRLFNPKDEEWKTAFMKTDKFTQDEDRKLMELHDLLGDKWQEIGVRLKKNRFEAQKRYVQLTEGQHHKYGGLKTRVQCIKEFTNEVFKELYDEVKNYMPIHPVQLIAARDFRKMAQAEDSVNWISVGNRMKVFPDVCKEKWKDVKRMLSIAYEKIGDSEATVGRVEKEAFPPSVSEPKIRNMKLDQLQECMKILLAVAKKQEISELFEVDVGELTKRIKEAGVNFHTVLTYGSRVISVTVIELIEMILFLAENAKMVNLQKISRNLAMKLVKEFVEKKGYEVNPNYVVIYKEQIEKLKDMEFRRRDTVVGNNDSDEDLENDNEKESRSPKKKAQAKISDSSTSEDEDENASPKKKTQSKASDSSEEDDEVFEPPPKKKSKAQKPDSSTALGDSSFLEYNFAGKKMFRRMTSLGAIPLMNIQLCDDQDEQGFDSGFEEFKKSLVEKLLTIFEKMIPFDDSILLPEKFRISYVDELDDQRISKFKSEFSEEGEKSSEVRGYTKLEVVGNEKVTADGHFQDTFLISLHNSCFSYKPGDVAQIQPENLDEVIQVAVEALGLSKAQLEKEFFLEKTNDFSSMPPSNMISYPTTLSKCFKHLFDINSLPTRRFFKSLSKLAVHEMEKERLEELANYNSFDDFLDYVRFPRRSISEVLRDFQHTSKIIPIERYFEVFPFIRPRSFSICSSYLKTPEILQVIVARVELKRKNMKTTRLGLCSNYLSRLKKGDLVTMTTGTEENLLAFLSPEAISNFLKINWVFLKLVSTFLGFFAFCISTQLVEFDIVNFFHKKTPEELELEERYLELNKMKEELSKISEMDEFANYHRKRRVILKKEDEFDALASKEKKNNLYQSMRLALISRFIVVLMAFFFSYFARDMVVAKIDGELIWPFGFMLTWPWIFGSYDEQGRIPVSLFNLLILISLANSAYERQKSLKTSQKIKKTK
ncbi:hypothetical protein FO519_006103 [Halicephalobus sp. NKZ332]|nr:hypothetical protein FO519_006103 [Halicephalobus sp. NKZ332]